MGVRHHPFGTIPAQRDAPGTRQRRSPTLTMMTIGLVAVAVFVFSIPYENGVTIPGMGTLARLVGLGAIAVVLVTLFGRGHIHVRAPSLFLIVMVVYTLWALITYFWSISPSATITRGFTLVQLAAMIWMIHQIGSTAERRDVLAQAFVLGSYASISVAMYMFFAGVQATTRDVGALNPNWFAIGCAFAVPIAWGLALRQRKAAWFWLNALYPAFALIAVVISASRGGFITYLVAMTVIPLTVTGLSLIRRILLLMVLGAAAGATFIVAPQMFTGLEGNLERLQGTADELAGGTLTGRTLIWSAGIDAFMSSPLVGKGYDTFGAAVEPVFGRKRSAHNAFLSIAVGAGVVGAGLFVLLLLIVFAGVLVSPVRRVEFVVVIVTLIVGMSPANLENNKSAWFLLGWLAAARPVMVRPVVLASLDSYAPRVRARVDRFRRRQQQSGPAPPR